jgi:molybdopterin/thiamine biosynthesis adenylyltransferase
MGAGGLGFAGGHLPGGSAGVGRLLLADADTVDLTNLQRQILHRQDAIGQPKVESGREHCSAA